MRFQFSDTGLGCLHALTFETEGLGHHGNTEDAEFACHFGDDGCRTGTRTATHAGRNKDHVRATQRFLDLLALLFSGLTTCCRLSARTQTRATQLHTMTRQAIVECLGIGIGGNEVHAMHVFTNHVVDGIATRATYTNHLDDCAVVFFLDNFKHHCLRYLISTSCWVRTTLLPMTVAAFATTSRRRTAHTTPEILELKILLEPGAH